MPEYQFTDRNGEIITENYDRSSYFSADQVLDSLRNAFQLFPFRVNIAQIENMDDVFHITYPDNNGFGEIFICGKGTTPGGRQGLKNEQRIQPKAKFLNYIYDQQRAGKKSALLGVYSKNDQTIFCAWKVMKSNAASPETPISKQIKIDSIAKAIQEGFVQYNKGHGEYACAFRPEFLYFYLRNNSWLHGDLISELTEHIPAENDIVNPEEQKERFRAWMGSQVKANGQPYSANTIASYISQIQRGYSEFNPYKDYVSPFQIQNMEELTEYIGYLFHADGFDAFNENAGNKSCSCGFIKYGEFLSGQSTYSRDLCFNTSFESDLPRNRIIFGAPGTGKSYALNQERKQLLGAENESDYERVTFHPDYTYANFVGTYKPVPFFNSEGEESITYKYIPGPFMRVYVNALKNGRDENARPFLLIIEEINRAEVAAVFGDIFQLLDRDDNEVSQYSIHASEDIKRYLAGELGGKPDDYARIRIPNNMFIWATMNSADQGVFPMDTAFKRRWTFSYIGIDDNDEELWGKTVILGTKQAQKVEWNKLRKAINKFLAKQKINEDKQLGPYFISRKITVPQNGNEIDRKKFTEAFKSKVIMYLFEDAARQKRPTLFEGCFQNSSRYSEICREFDEKGLEIFHHEIILDSDAEDLSAENNVEDAAE